jgi:serine/threonine protein kinase
MSRDALDLVTRMLDSDPVTRISINDALVHPWIAQHLGSQVITANSLQLT